MRFFLLILSIVIAAFLVVLGVNQFRNSQDIAFNIAVLEEQIQKGEQHLKIMRAYKISPETSLNKGFYNFCNMIEVLAKFNQSSASIEIPGYKNSKNIEEFFQQSELEGVRKINLKISFKDLKDPLDSVFILTTLKESRKNVSFEIISISSQFDKLEIIANLYGA